MKLVVLTLMLLAAVLAMDLYLPLGVAGGVPYVAVVLVSLGARKPRWTTAVAAIGSTLTIVGLLFSPGGGTLWVVLVNRALALGAIWGTAALSLLARFRSTADDSGRLVGDGVALNQLARTVNSSLEPTEVGKAFVEQIGRLIRWETITVHTIDPDLGLLASEYRAGAAATHSRSGSPAIAESFTLDPGTLHSGRLVNTVDGGDLDEVFSPLTVLYERGLRSFLVTPLNFDDRLIGVLTLALSTQDGYTNRDLDVAAQSGAHLAVAIANARVHQERKRQAYERSVVAEIGLAINSSPNIREAYDKFVEEAHKIVPFDRLAFGAVDAERRFILAHYSHESGKRLPVTERPVPLQGTQAGEAILRREAVVAHPHDRDEVNTRSPSLTKLYDEGFRSFLSVPLFRSDIAIGVLGLRSRQSNAYTYRYVALVERIARQIAGPVGNAQLFAELEQTEKELRKSREQSSSLMENTPDGIYIIDPEYNMQFVNRTFSGQHPRELFDRSVFEFIPLKYHATARSVYDRAMETGEPGNYEMDGVGPPGAEISVSCRVGPIFDDGKITALSIIATDITEQKELQARFIQSQKMDAIGTLAGGVAHDFNNLLTAIGGYAALGADDSQSEGLLNHYFNEIITATDRAAHLTRQLLAFSRKQNSAPVRLDLNKLLLEMGAMIRRLIGENIEVVSLPHPMPVVIEADPGQVEQVLVNLVVNARDAMPDGG
ncbi:MAG: GAF domain-containing protein [SAR202 cluster bacterium]|nr:GAF domain-containing protein [SAR202 cluster bacterium]